jgi:hypothetical protein
MTAARPTGLGDSDLPGKLSLFRPPRPQPSETQTQTPQIIPVSNPGNPLRKRIRTTLDLTWEALQIIQELQQQHRLQTGKVLPLWKTVSQIIERYGKHVPGNPIRR